MNRPQLPEKVATLFRQRFYIPGIAHMRQYHYSPAAHNPQELVAAMVAQLPYAPDIIVVNPETFARWLNTILPPDCQPPPVGDLRVSEVTCNTSWGRVSVLAIPFLVHFNFPAPDMWFGWPGGPDYALLHALGFYDDAPFTRLAESLDAPHADGRAGHFHGGG